MKILNISLDKRVLDKNSAMAQRVVEYGNLVGQYTVLVLADNNDIIKLSDNAKAIAIKKKGRISSLFKLKKKAKEILKTDRYNVITVQDAYFIGRLALKLAKKFQIGLEVQVHGFEKLNFIRKKIAKYVLKNADAIRVVSQRLRQELINEFKVEAEKITAVPILAEIRNQKPETRNYKKAAEEKFVFLTIGRLVPVKNIGLQTDVLAAVGRKHSLVELWIVGDGPERKKLEDMVETSRPSNEYGASRGVYSIRFFGWRDDLENYYSQADAFLLTSNSEGWGMAVVEAAAHGLPIIMTDVGLAGEVIKDNESGIVIPVGGRKALENAMIKLIEDENLRKKLGEGAREAVKKLPTRKETLELYKKSWEGAMKNLPC